MSAESCFHCGENIPPRLDITLTIDDKPAAFCCYGCQAIAEFIHTEALSNYYQHRTELANSANQTKNNTQIDTLSLLNDPELYALYVHQDKDNHQLLLSIQGMTCAACAWLIEKHLSKLTGIESIHINLSSSIATLIWQPKQIELSTIAHEVQHLGYHIVPYRADNQDNRRQQERKSAIIRLGIAGVGMMQVMMSAIALYAGAIQGIEDSYRDLLRWSSFIFTTPVVFYAAMPFFKAALRDLRTRHFTMDLPVSIGIGLAYVSSIYAMFSQGEHVYFDSVTMFTFFLLLGRFVEEAARHKSLSGNQQKADLIPVKLVTDTGIIAYPKARLKVGDRVLVSPGESFPTDGIIVEGETNIDESSLTGEYLPLLRQIGDQVTAATTNIDQTVQVKVSAVGAQTRAAAIERLTERALSEKPKIALLADKVAHYFVLVVLIVAAATYLGWYWIDPAQAYWIMVSVLVVTCPCALSLATPVALTSATNRLKDLGLLVTRGHVIESLAKCEHLIFDKTGTLTYGKFAVIDVISHSDNQNHSIDQKHSTDHILAICAALEADSIHPLAAAFTQPNIAPAKHIKNHIGLGVAGEVDGIQYRLGNMKFIEHWTTDLTHPILTDATSLTLYLATQNSIIGCIILKDRLRKESLATLHTLRQQGLNVSLLTGDSFQSASDILQPTDFDHFMTDQSPEQKWQWLASLNNQHSLMVGDGLNDVPTLAGATTSIAMGESSDLAKLHADAVLLNNQIATIALAITLAKKCRIIIKQNLFWAAAYNSIMLPAAVLGFVPPWAAAIGMAGSSLFVVLNATRLSK